MTENIELDSICNYNSEKEESEEYHEINQEVIEDITHTIKLSDLSITDYDFFVNYDTQKAIKVSLKKKKSKKKHKSNNFIDILNLEIASTPFLTENIINVDESKEQSSYLKVYKKNKLMQWPQRNLALQKSNERNYANISPIFPRVLEAATRKEVIINVQYVEPSLFSEVVTEYQEIKAKGNPKFLDITLKNIKFKHHHEFSLEKLLCVKLLDIYDNLKSVKNSLLDVSKQIDVNRRTRNSLKEQLVKMGSISKEDIKFDKSVLKYTKTMLDFKETYFDTLKKEKEIVNHLLSLWADIITIRKRSGHKETDYVVEILTNIIDENDFQKLWLRTFEVEYADLIIKMEYNFIIEYYMYKEYKRNVEKTKDKSNITRPKLNIDYDSIKAQVENMVNDILSRNNVEIKVKAESNDKKGTVPLEKNFCFKVFVDDVFVCESEQYTNKNALLEINFIESLTIEILPQNKFLTILLFENNEDVSSFRVALSDIKKNTSESCYLNKIFVYHKNVLPTDRQVGSECEIKEICVKNKVRLKSSNLFKRKLRTRCEVNIKLGWNEKLSDKQLESIQSSIKIGCQLKRFLNNIEQLNIQKLTDIINYIYDNNITENKNIMKALTEVCKSDIKTPEPLFFSENLPEFTRFKLLYLRNNGGFNAIQNKVVPLFTSQISTELLECLQKTKEKDYRDIKMDSEIDTINVQRFIGIKFVEKLNKNLMTNLNETLMKKSYKDVVKDFGDTSFGYGNIFSNQIDLSLTAISNISKQQILRESISKDQELQIHILRAYNLTEREVDSLLEKDDNAENIAGFKIHPLRPFVRASYHGVSAQTAPGIGCHPTWNCTIKIKSKFDPLSTIHINVYDECKDATDMHYNDESTRNLVHYRKVNKWLGSIHVPLHTVLILGSIRGTFKINTPPLIFGYENTMLQDTQISDITQLMKKQTSLLVLQITTSLSHLGGYQIYSQPVPNDHQDDVIIQYLNKFLTDYVNDYPDRNISLTFIDSCGKNKCVAEFLQPIPLPDYEIPIDVMKLESALSKSSGYSRSSSSKSSNKRSSLTEEKKHASSGLESRMSGENDIVKKIDAVVRYVSLIPTYDVAQSHLVTLMGVELLKVLYGSPLDHTILLCSYFLNLGIKCWIIIGFGLPRGQSSYVLVKYSRNRILTYADEMKRPGKLWNKPEDYTLYIFDAVSGERFELRELRCPLKTVSYLFNCENIWVNTQASQACESVSFDLSKSSDWQKVFNKPLFVTRPLITDTLYSSPADVENLRLNLETKIKNKIQKWRSHVKTIWNRYCSSLLKEMLPHYEYWAFNSSEPRPSPGHRLKQFMATYKIHGFPLNMPYINTKLIISNIKSTAIYVNDNPNVELGLGVEVYAYPNNVLSVWVFLASITRIYS